MATIPSTRGNPQATDIAVQTALPMVGSASREDLQATLAFVDAELAKLFEDRNILLVGGGTVTFTGTDVQFTEAIELHINSKVAGGSPTIIDLAATTRTVSADGRMIYAVLNRGAGTATVTDDASTLPAVTSTDQEVVLIAKRVDDGTGVKRLYFRNGSAFNEGQSAPLGSAGSGGGGGGKNYIKSPDDAYTNWLASGAGVTVATTTTSSELPEQSKKAGIKITPVSGSDYAYTRFTIDRADKLKTLGVVLQVKSDSGYADDDLELQVWTNTLSDYTGTYVQLTLDREAGIKKSDNGNTQIWTVAALSADYYEVRIKRNAGTSFIVTSGVTLGPDVANIAPVVTDWIDYTPTYSPGAAVTSAKVRYRIVGSAVEIQGRVLMAGGGTGTNDFLVSLPPGMSINTSIYPHGGGTDLGSNEIYQVPRFYTGNVTYQGLGNDTHIAFLTSYAAGTTGGNEVRVLKDPDLNAGDNLTFTCTVQIQELAGKGTVQIGPGPDVEYASNSSSTDADDLTSFVKGRQGSAGVLGVTTLTGTRQKYVQFDYAIQPDDHLQIEISPDGERWFPMIGYIYSSSENYSIQPLTTLDTASLTDSSGIAMEIVNSNTISVFWGRYAQRYIGYTSGWNAYVGFKWRVKKVRAGALVGVKLADETGFPGLVNPYSTNGVVYSGTWNPGDVGSSNIDGIINTKGFYTRVGNLVTFTIQADIDATSAAVTTARFSLPPDAPSTFDSAEDVVGVGTNSATNNVANMSASLSPQGIAATWIAISTASTGWSFSGQYVIKP